MEKEIPLFYWSETRLMGKAKENYGDLLSRYIVKKISERPVKWINPAKTPWYSFSKKHFSAIGSILHHTSKNTIVWGSGIIDQQRPIKAFQLLAVRGPHTRKYAQSLGLECPEVFGDPALLLPEFFNPSVEKEYDLGVIPHYNDYHLALKIFKDEKGVKVIDLMTNDIEDVTVQILKCEKTISSSLHGIIVSHAYGIPSVQVKFSDRIFGDGIKYLDYYNSVDIDGYEAPNLRDKGFLKNIAKHFNLSYSIPDQKVINDLCEKLLKVNPF